MAKRIKKSTATETAAASNTVELNKVTINGVHYVGRIVKDDEGNFTLADAMQCTEFNRGAISEYLKRENSGELENVEFGGMGVSYAVAGLTDDEEMNLNIGRILMTGAKDKAMSSVENNLFDALSKK